MNSLINLIGLQGLTLGAITILIFALLIADAIRGGE